MENSTLPNLLVIGAMKSGTTSLHHYLSIHPRIFMSEIKELNYFIEEENASKGIDWYKSNFDSQYKYNGESSQNYTKRHLVENVAENIFNTLGNVKLIYVIRNPIDRLISHVHESISQGYREVGFDLNLELNELMDSSNFILTGKYFFQLEPFIEYFDKDSIKIVLLEELKKNPIDTMNDIFKWLNIDCVKEGELQFEVRNSFSDKKRATFLGKWIRSHKTSRVIKLLLPKRVRKIIKQKVDIDKMTLTNFEPIVLDDEIRKRLSKIYSEDLNLLLEYVSSNDSNDKIIDGLKEMILELD